LLPQLSISSCGNLDEVVYSEHPDSALEPDAIAFDFASACVSLGSLKDDHVYDITCFATPNSHSSQNMTNFLTDLTRSASLFYGYAEGIFALNNTHITLHGVHVNNKAGKGFIWDQPDILSFSYLPLPSFEINCHATDLEIIAL
jgi:hypothetical protein